MIIRQIFKREKEKYNHIVSHPCQSWEWGEFREKTGAQVVRIGVFQGKKIVSGFQFSFHLIPWTSYTIGYLPRGPMINKAMIKVLKKFGQKKNCVFFRIEPNVIKTKKKEIKKEDLDLKSAARSFFYRYTFLINLQKTEEELLKQMKQKTRYNLRLAERRGVKVSEDNSQRAFENYLRLLKETTRRQGFFAHSENYQRKMWKTLKPAGIAHLLKAEYQGKILATWILFKFHDVLYYPYGASSSSYRNLMANNLMMWEAIKLGKKLGCRKFDLWGCLGPRPDPNDSWYGFHRFKEGYGGELVEFIGSFDLVLKPTLYRLYNLTDTLRWRLLKLKAGFYRRI